MELGKKIILKESGYSLCLAELVVGGREIDPVVELSSQSLDVLHHILLFPEPELAFNQQFNHRTNCYARSFLIYHWRDSVNQNRLMDKITREFTTTLVPSSEFQWNTSIVPWRDGEVISIVFGHTRPMNRLYDQGLRTRPPAPTRPWTLLRT